MDALQIIWFVLIGVLFAGFFALEGFDFGVGIVSGILAKTDKQKQQLIKSIGPTWESNQVWLITAGGAMLAAFPSWYATMFSSYYLALVLMIFSLIIRGLSLEYRSKLNDNHKGIADKLFVTGNVLSAILWGVVMANSIKGISIDDKMHYAGTFFDLLSPYAIFGGVVTLMYFTAHGASFLLLKGPKDMETAFVKIARNFHLATFVTGVLFLLYTTMYTQMLSRELWSVGIVAVLLPLVVAFLTTKKNYVVAFIISFLIPMVAVGALFGSMFPNVMLSSLAETNHLTIANASSGHATLTLMLIVTGIFLPLILGYKIWVYRMFSARVADKNLEY